MNNWKQKLHQLSLMAEEHFDALKERVVEKSGLQRKPRIVAYRSYGLPGALWLNGRVLRDQRSAQANEDDTAWENLSRMLRRIESDEISGVTVQAIVEGHTLTMVSDEDGYFSGHLHAKELQQRGWMEVSLQLNDLDFGRVTTTAECLVPHDAARFGVISDIDDTIIQTDATNILKAAKNTLFGNAKSRTAFPGVESFYRALLSGGSSDPELNPIFYVSNGPWNLYGFIEQFQTVNEIPKGPLLLRDYGLTEEQWFADSEHKRKRIGQILECYPQLSFVLIGDSGEYDPEIYLDIVHRYPGRIQAIFIRDVSDSERDRGVEKITEQLQELEVPLIMAETMEAAALYAFEEGMIDADGLQQVRASLYPSE